MSHRWTLAVLAATLSATPLAAQAAPVKMPAGDYVVQARDTTKAKEVAIAGWPFALKGNGAFAFSSPDDGLTFSGKLVQKDGVATYTDQGCDQPATYTVRQERGGYAFDFKSGGCAENATSLDKLLFVSGKPKR